MEATEHTRRAVVDAIHAVARNPVIRWIVGGLLAALCSVALFAARSEFSKLTAGIAGQSEAIAAQNDAIKAQSAALGQVEKRIGDISEKLASVEGRYAGHDTRINDVVRQVDELRRRIDQMVVERDMRLQRWEGAMAKDEADKAANKALRTAIRQLAERAARGAPTAP